MSEYPGGYPDAAVQPKTGWSTGKKVGCGCLIVFLVLVILCAVGGWIVYQKYGKVILPYFENYAVVRGQSLTVSEEIVEPTLYQCQAVTIEGTSHADLAFWAQAADIKGTVHGNVDLLFLQDFVLHEGAIIDGDLHVPILVQSITINSGAVITGNITGELAQLITLEDGAIVGGTISLTVQTQNQDPGTMVGQGVPDDIRALIDASRQLPEDPGEGGG